MDQDENHEKPTEYAEKDEEEAEEDPLAPTRWWIVSTLFPLIAATFGPMACTFSICSLVVDWIITVNPDSNENEGLAITDPPWLYAVNGISLGIAVAANLALLALMTGRGTFALAQTTVIIGWYLASLLLICLVTVVPLHLQLPGQVLSQAFYYACIAAALYFILACMMVVTAWGVYRGHFSNKFKLTTSQRSLMVQTMFFLGYILAGGAVFSRVEGWNFLDAVYFADVTVLTIGFGDFAPKTHLGRSLTFPMAAGGVLFLGLIVSSITALVLEAATTKITLRMVEKERQKMVHKAEQSQEGAILRPRQPSNSRSADSSEVKRRKQEFDLMRRVQKKAADKNRIIALSVSGGATCILWFVGAVAFWQAEMGAGNWSYFQSIYFTYISLLTIGYGDFIPANNSSKPAFVFWSLIALPTLTILIGAISNQIAETFRTTTLWISEHMPEKGPLAALKGSAIEEKKGDGGAYKGAKPPGFMSDGSEEVDERDFDNSATADAVKGMTKDIEDEGGGNSAVQTDTNFSNAQITSKRYRHYLLMKEMRNVVNHMDASPPRQYTFAEWTWLLKLVGEDESDRAQHRKLGDVKDALGTKEKSSDADAGTRGDDGKVQPWSWLGHKSPLMNSMDEPQWILRRMIDTMERELKEAADELDGRK